MQDAYKVTIRRVYKAIVALDKQQVLLICVCVCVDPRVRACECARVGLLTQHAKCMRRIMLLSVASAAVSYFSTLSHKRQDFRGEKKKVTEYTMCISISFTKFI